MDATSNGDNAVPTKAAIEEGVQEALTAAGFVMPDGTKDFTKLRQTILGIVKDAKVLNRKERDEKAITRGNLTAKVLPELPGPGSWSSRLEEEVYKKIDAMVWGETLPNATKVVQRLVAVHFGNGYVLCRARVGLDRTEAVYVTDDYACIDEDFVQADNAKVERALKNATNNREMLVIRQPKNAKRYVHGYRQTFQAQLSNGTSRMNLALQAATASHEADDVEEEEEEAGQN